VDTVIFACLAGLLFGAVNVAVLRGLRMGGDIEAGMFFVMVAGLPLVGVAAAIGGRGGHVDVGDLWPFLLIGAVVPGIAQILAARAVQEIGASRTGVLLGTTPVASALIAIAVFDEPIRAGLAAGTVLIVAGGIVLSWERKRPVYFRRIGMIIALIVAVTFGIRDNVVRWVGGDVSAEPLVQTFVLFIGATAALGLYLLIRGGSEPRLERLRTSVAPFLPVAILHALGNVFILEAVNSGRVTVAAPLVATAALWSVLLAAVSFRTSEAIGARVVVVAIGIVAGGVLIGATR
jgi:drug/metabolite transporter (DMT)-like permease